MFAGRVAQLCHSERSEIAASRLSCDGKSQSFVETERQRPFDKPAMIGEAVGDGAGLGIEASAFAKASAVGKPMADTTPDKRHPPLHPLRGGEHADHR